MVSCYDSSQLQGCFQRLERSLRAGFWFAGFITYEAGLAFEEVLTPREPEGFPLLWFGVYREPLMLDHSKPGSLSWYETAKSQEENALFAEEEGYSVADLRMSVGREEYVEDIHTIREYIAQGHTYQVNYTFKCKFSFAGSPYLLFTDLNRKQSVSYATFVKFGARRVLSLSPELFFRKEGATVMVKPMKGSWERGRTLEEDRQNVRRLASSIKNRAENVMIVDLMRNDLGRISHIGSVKTPRLFEVERYETLFQMTSTVEGRVNTELPLYRLFANIFPCGSVTGAPKIRTMQIIGELESEPRGVYTGCIGFVSPQRNAAFNVAIRTLLLDERTGEGEMGIGSGIVYDSVPEEEYEECILKARFLALPALRFQLIETLRWDPVGGYFLLDLHLARLKESAEYFGFTYDQARVLKALQVESHRFKAGRRYRVRLLMDREGELEVSSSPLIEDDASEPKRAVLSSHRTCSSDAFLFHKTTNRRLYDAELERFRVEGYFDVLFRNEQGELTEGAISNLFLRKDGWLHTPPLSCGLLKGTYRTYLLERSGQPCRERVLYEEDLREADEIYLANSVRGLVKVQVDPDH